MTAKEALTKAWSIINHANQTYTDKIELFYRITPYTNRNFNAHDGYISWFLASNYCSRNQLLKIIPQRTCWVGQPPDEYFIKNLTKEMFELRKRMSIAIKNITNDNLDQYDAYRCSDEIHPLDIIFLKNKKYG